ncbi:hypothetical protein HUT19_17165 [Streptomyces sp. NA02950]|uniref:hypothetical protein n=1 Tax=Streptomyces sp. NA02950 TaxID=2742137 RepID=UPI0015907649|nr:hypothetical protein [Streptomyces sp. NA02950]QKV93277.1 hypothetical protein HUT19_17165 [Streptomyces sp. NA02950]
MSEQLGYTDVKNANLTPLREAVTKWSQAPGKFQQIDTNFGTDVTKGLAHSDWQGEAADAAWRTLRAVRRQILAAAEEARRVHNVMKQGLEKFTSAKSTLDAIEKELEGHEYLKLNKHDGSVYLDLPDDQEKNRAAMTKSYQDTFAGYRERTRKALELAGEADSALVQALTADVNGEKRGFNDHAYNSLDQAREATAKDLKKAIELAGTENGRLSSTQLAQLSVLMARHSQAPEFAERFATKLKADGTLKLWYNATHPHNPLYPDTDIDDKAWWKSAKSLQRSLGMTLATASHVDTPAMAAWKDEMIRLGPSRLDDSGGRTHPFGFQIMSNLMRTGTYDKDFLNAYGGKLVAWDKKNNTEKGFPYWTLTGENDTLNVIGRHGDTGMDAMTGFLEGLGHNPEASTEFFRKPEDGGLNPRFEYLTQDRNWIFDGNTRGGPRDLPGHEALGHALTAATTGYSWDAEEVTGKDPEIFRHGGDRRTASTADVMEQVVAVYGGKEGPRLLHDQPAMAASLGRMGGAYVDDLNYYMSGVGEDGRDGKTFPPAYEGRADFKREGSLNFLSVLGHNKTSHGLMNQAEHLYTLSQIAAHPPADGAGNYTRGSNALLTEAEVRGVLDQSRAAQIEATYAHDSAEAQKAFQESSNWTRVGYSASAPAVSQGIVSVVGKAGPWGLIVPVAMGAGQEFAKVFHNDAVFGGPDAPKPPDSSGFFKTGENQLGKTMGTYFGGHGPSGESDRLLGNEIKENYYGSGAGAGQYRGLKPYTG